MIIKVSYIVIWPVIWHLSNLLIIHVIFCFIKQLSDRLAEISSTRWIEGMVPFVRVFDL